MTKNVNFAYWSVLGLIIHSSSAESEQEKNIQLELAKRTLIKLGLPFDNAKLASVHKQLLMILLRQIGDLNAFIEAARIVTPYDPSDDKKEILKALIEIKEYQKAFEHAEAILKSGTGLDFEVWKLLCSIPDSRNIICSRILPQLEASLSSDKRGIKLAKFYLDSQSIDTNILSFSKSLLDYTIEMKSNRSTIFDVIKIINDFNDESIDPFAIILQSFLNSVRLSIFLSFNNGFVAERSRSSN